MQEMNKCNGNIKKKRGLFISVEGIDGAGKSTHVAFIKEYLASKGLQVITTREPGGTMLGEKIRKLLLDESNNIHRITELLLIFASRQELIANIIVPNLEQGVSVVADRFIDASIAYQGAGREIGVDKIKQIITLLEPRVPTDLTFLFNVALDVAYKRVTNNKAQDRIEQEDQQFFAKVQNAYLQIAEVDPIRVKVIDTANTIKNTRMSIMKHIDQLLYPL